MLDSGIVMVGGKKAPETCVALILVWELEVVTEIWFKYFLHMMFWELMLIFVGEGYSFIILYNLYNFTCDVDGKFWSSDMVVMRFKDN